MASESPSCCSCPATPPVPRWEAHGGNPDWRCYGSSARRVYGCSEGWSDIVVVVVAWPALRRRWLVAGDNDQLLADCRGLGQVRGTHCTALTGTKRGDELWVRSIEIPHLPLEDVRKGWRGRYDSRSSYHHVTVPEPTSTTLKPRQHCLGDKYALNHAGDRLLPACYHYISLHTGLAGVCWRSEAMRLPVG